MEPNKSFVITLYINFELVFENVEKFIDFNKDGNVSVMYPS